MCFSVLSVFRPQLTVDTMCTAAASDSQRVGYAPGTESKGSGVRRISNVGGRKMVGEGKLAEVKTAHAQCLALSTVGHFERFPFLLSFLPLLPLPLLRALRCRTELVVPALAPTANVRAP